MSIITSSLRKQIKDKIKDSLIKKMKDFEPETSYTPFVSPFFSEENIKTHSVVHGFYTSLGTTYEYIAMWLAQSRNLKAQRQYKLLGTVNPEAGTLITEIVETKSNGKAIEVEKIRQTIQPGPASTARDNTVDVFLVKEDGTEVYIDITTAKPNIKGFGALRRKMLKWTALRLSQDTNAKIETYIGIPYNPYSPNPYVRWTSATNDASEILVQEDLWSMFAGYNVYPELTEIFKEAGDEIRVDVTKFLKGQYRKSR